MIKKSIIEISYFSSICINEWMHYAVRPVILKKEKPV